MSKKINVSATILKYATEFYDWTKSRDGKDLIQDLKMIGELPKKPTSKELFEVYIKYCF